MELMTAVYPGLTRNDTVELNPVLLLHFVNNISFHASETVTETIRLTSTTLSEELISVKSRLI